MRICQIDFEFYGKKEHVEVTTARYADGRPALVVFNLLTGEPWTKLSVNVPEERLADGEYIIKTWSENENLIGPAMASGRFIDTGRRVMCGHCWAPVWKLKGD